MSFRSKLKIENKRTLVTSTFYAVAGVVFLVLLPIASFAPHLGILGILSLVTAYAVLMKRVWATWFVVMLFFVGTTFSAFIIYNALAMDYLTLIGAIAYLILTWIFTIYTLTKRKAFES